MAPVFWIALASQALAPGGESPPAAQGTILPPASEVARLLQARYDGIRDFSADFTQTYEGGVLRQKVTERGTVSIMKPGRMRWTYTTPTDKTFVSDGRLTYFYVPEDRQVQIGPLPAEDQATSAVLFFTGKGDLTRDFEIAYADTLVSAERHALRLVPHERQGEYDWLILEVDRETLQIRGLTAGDQQGGTSSFSLDNIKENTGLTDKTFTFTVPPGVDVIGSEHLEP